MCRKHLAALRTAARVNAVLAFSPVSSPGHKKKVVLYVCEHMIDFSDLFRNKFLDVTFFFRVY